MAKSIKNRLIERLDGYYKLEGFNAALFFGISIYVLLKNNVDEVIFLTYGIWFMVYILVQGTIYWWIKMLSIKGKSIDQKYYIRLFKRFRITNIVFGFAIQIILLIKWYINPDAIGWNSLFYWALFANAFAIAEHINYYNKQLMYDNPYDWQYLKHNKRLKEASLKKDLKEQKI